MHGIAAGQAADPFRAADYAALRKQLRAFYPDECHGKCKDPAFDESDRAIRADLRAYAAAHPEYDALDLRRESYCAMRKHFRPFLFSESPFYFEAGVNGGWVMGIMPAREVNNLCRRFYREKGLVPDEAFARQRERRPVRRTIRWDARSLRQRWRASTPSTRFSSSSPRRQRSGLLRADAQERVPPVMAAQERVPPVMVAQERVPLVSASGWSGSSRARGAVRGNRRARSSRA